MPYTYIRISPKAAPLSEVMNSESDYNKGVRRELTLTLTAPELLTTLRILIQAHSREFPQGGPLANHFAMAEKIAALIK